MKKILNLIIFLWWLLINLFFFGFADFSKGINNDAFLNKRISDKIKELSKQNKRISDQDIKIDEQDKRIIGLERRMHNIILLFTISILSY